MASKVRFAGKHIHLPASKNLRIGLGVLLVVGGLVGFLPVVGFWMIPLGLLVLSVDLPIVRRWRRSLEVKWQKWRRGETTAERRDTDRKNGRVKEK
jgi:hypothetical protein